MLGGARVFAVVPARNEAPRIARVVGTMPAEVDAIFVVDDASDDATAEAARGTSDPRLTVIRHETNRGVGAAIVTGYRAALAREGSPRDAFVVMAGDGQMDPRDLPALVRPVVRGDAGYVKGDRFSHPEIPAMPRARRLGGEVLSRMTSLAIGLSIHDSQCGYTALSREACAKLDLDAVWPRYGYPNDLLAQLAARKITIREERVRPVYAGEPSGLRVWHVATISRLVARAWVRRVLASV